MRLAEAPAELRQELVAMLSSSDLATPRPYTLQASLIADLFHRLDGRTVERIASFVRSKLETPAAVELLTGQCGAGDNG